MCGSVAGVAWQFVGDMEHRRVMPERLRESHCDKSELCCVSSCCDVEAMKRNGVRQFAVQVVKNFLAMPPGVQSQIGGAGDFVYTAMCGTLTGCAVCS